MDRLTAHCAETELLEATPGPQWVHLLPGGLIRGRDGRQFVLDKPDAVIAASLDGADLPIDYEHQMDDPAARLASAEVPAAGWIKRLELRADGIWGLVDWTEKAQNMIAAREYRYLSPVFHHQRDGRIVRLIGAGLVHRPNLPLKALSCEETGTGASSLGAVAAALGLPASAAADAILMAVNALRTPDPEQFVPVAAVRELLADRNGKIALMSEREVTVRVDEALASGHITPGMRDWATALCRQNPDSFDEFLKAPAAWAHLFREAVRGKPPASRGGAGSAEEKAICAQLGIDPSRLT
ncbi:phage protease [Cereibacter sphaeroides]|uniref:phage protease n=1 Tax=Cereibacter sphaeroides TaxID=1063 RepID=UPI003FCD9C55